MKRCSARDLGINIGKFPTGKANDLTDINGVKVGHHTLIQDSDIRTGVTTIIPCQDIFKQKPAAGSFVLSGAGEMTGLVQTKEWGVIETPIVLTNTMSVGIASQATSKWMVKNNQDITKNQQVIIPVVGECDDSFLHSSTSFSLTEEDVYSAFESASEKGLLQGSVGGGTGMVCCDFKGGIGSSSRTFSIENSTYTLGVLVQSNFGHMEDLRVDGLPIGRIISKDYSDIKKRVNNDGSIITVIITDLPLSAHQLERLSKRSALGIGRAGSFAAHHSGEIILSISVPVQKNMIKNELMNPVYEATIEATEEAIINSLTFSGDMNGRQNNHAPGIDLQKLKEVYSQYKDLEKKLTH